MCQKTDSYRYPRFSKCAHKCSCLFGSSNCIETSIKINKISKRLNLQIMLGRKKYSIFNKTNFLSH